MVWKLFGSNSCFQNKNSSLFNEKTLEEIVGKDVKIKFNKKNTLKDHYKITPFSYKTRMAKKIQGDGYIDLGEGILDLVNRKIKNNK